MRENRFHICKSCGNIVGMLHDSGTPIMCCGREMTRLEPNTSDKNSEKHLPKVTVKGDTVTVDIEAVTYPTAEDHGVPWVYLQTDRGGQRKCLIPHVETQAFFSLCNEKPVAVYAFCDMNGLWKTDI